MMRKMTPFESKRTCYVDDESDIDEEYFSWTYRPLSNLPTPPPSSRESLASQSPRSLLEQDQLLESALLGPAVHLVNLIPPTASLATPSVPTVHGILRRANLPSETIALAVCILDSLNSKFSHNWRLACPLARSRPEIPDQIHIDAVRPEVIILSSLVIAVKFVVDSHKPTTYYASAWGDGLWTCEQINVTERCIMESLGYRILPLWDRGLIADALADMERAGRQATVDRLDRFEVPSATAAHKRPMSSAKAIRTFGLPLTPIETPNIENAVSRHNGGDAGPAEEPLVLAGEDVQTALMDRPTSLFHLDPLQLSKKRNDFSSCRAYDPFLTMG